MKVLTFGSLQYIMLHLLTSNPEKKGNLKKILDPHLRVQPLESMDTDELDVVNWVPPR